MSRLHSSEFESELLAELQDYQKLASALPHDDVKMDLPKEARKTIEQGAWKIRWQGFICIVGPSNKKCFDATVEMFNQTGGRNAHVVSQSVSPVTFGAVKGFKRIVLIPDLNSKDIDYVLQVPGGFVSVGILKRGIKWEESEWERFFHTIQMIKR